MAPPLLEEATPLPPAADDLRSLLDRLRPSFGRILGRFGIPPHDAQDLLQDAVCHYLLNRPQIHSPEPWLCSVLRNQCRIYWRGRARGEAMRARAALRGPVPLEDAASPPEADLNTRLDLANALARLPEWKRELLLRHDLSGEDNHELAQRFDYRVASIRKTLHRVRAHVRSRLRAYAAEPGDTQRKEREP